MLGSPARGVQLALAAPQQSPIRWNYIHDSHLTDVSIKVPKQLMQSSECKYDIIPPLVCDLLSYSCAKYIYIFLLILFQDIYFFSFLVPSKFHTSPGKPFLAQWRKTLANVFVKAITLHLLFLVRLVFLLSFIVCCWLWYSLVNLRQKIKVRGGLVLLQMFSRTLQAGTTFWYGS